MAGAHRGAGKGHGHAPAAGGASTHAAFFTSLPKDELTPLETGLRQVLLDWIASLGNTPFPLTEWVDRRVGGEIETRKDEQGRVEIFTRGSKPPPGTGARPVTGHYGPPPVGHAPPPGNFGHGPPPGMGFPPPAYPPHNPHMPPRGPPAAAVAAAVPPAAPVNDRKGAGKAAGPGGAEAFLRSLPADSFSRAEEDLREAIFDFLTSWKSKALAGLNDLQKDANLQKVKARFLPKEVTLSEWIEKRIGGEVQLKKEGPSGSLIIHLSPAATDLVRERYKKMEAAGKGSSSASRSVNNSQPAHGKGADRNPMSKEDFWKTLPEEELLPEELAMRDAILDFLERWSAPRTALMHDLQSNGGVSRCKSFLPPQVSIRDWIERRIGGEVEIRKDAKGNPEVFQRGKPPRGGNDQNRGTKRSAAHVMSPEEWFKNLPDDSLTDAEANLRSAVLNFLDSRGGPVMLGEASKEPSIASAHAALLPQEVPLRMWVDRRIGGEIKIDKDNKGQWMMSKANYDAPASQGDKKEEFFAHLPDDSFTNQEEDLRDALLAFLGNWSGAEPPSLSEAGGDGEIRRARPLVLPKGCPVSLKDWIERRIGGEIEVAMDHRSGQWLFGLRGNLELPAAARGNGQDKGGSKKRR